MCTLRPTAYEDGKELDKLQYCLYCKKCQFRQTYNEDWENQYKFFPVSIVLQLVTEVIQNEALLCKHLHAFNSLFPSMQFQLLAQYYYNKVFRFVH